MLIILCNFNPCLAWGFTIHPTPTLVPFSMSYPPDWYYQMHRAVNSPWKWLGPFGGADVFQSSHHWPSPKPHCLPSPSPPPPPSFAPPRVWQRLWGLGVGVEQWEEEGDVIEGWNHAIPQGAPTSPSPSSIPFNPGDPLRRQGLRHVFEYSLCECEKVFQVA